VTTGAYRLSVEQDVAAAKSNAPKAKSGRRSARARSIVLLTEFKATQLDDELQFLANMVSRHLLLHLLGADGIVAIGPIPWTARTARDACASPEATKTAADFLLEGELKSGQPGNNGHRTIDIGIRLHDIATGNHLWSQDCTERFNSRNLEALPEIIAARLVAIMPKSFA
jgi:TolB-like protein